MKVDADFTRGASRLIYPELPDPLTAADLKRVFSPSHAEREWAPTIARSPTSQVVLLVQLNPGAAIARIVELVKTRIPRRFGLDPIRDIQVLCPMNRGDVGARSLNIELQAALNPVGEQSALIWVQSSARKSALQTMMPREAR